MLINSTSKIPAHSSQSARLVPGNLCNNRRSFYRCLMKKVGYKQLSSKLFAASEDADKAMTEDRVKKLFEKVLAERKIKKIETKQMGNKSSNPFLGENLNRAGQYLSLLGLYLALSAKINGVIQHIEDKFDSVLKSSNEKADSILKSSNESYDKLKDLINIDIRTMITKLENKTSNLAVDIND